MAALTWTKEPAAQETFDASDGQGNTYQVIILADGHVSASKNGAGMGTTKFDDLAQAKEAFRQIGSQ